MYREKEIRAQIGGNIILLSEKVIFSFFYYIFFVGNINSELS